MAGGSSTGAGATRTSSPRSSRFARPPLGLRAHLGFGEAEVEQPVPLEQVELRPPRIEVAGHAERDRRGRTARPRVARARARPTATWCGASAGSSTTRPTRCCARATSTSSSACSTGRARTTSPSIPYGGGTSVVGGIEPRGLERGASRVDLKALDRVLEIDRVSRAARIQAGATGPGARGPAARARAHAAGTSRSRSSTRRSAAGSPRAPAATSPRC